MKLSLPDRTVISIQREAGPEEYIPVPALNDDGVPAMSGHLPTMADLEEVELHIRYEVAVLQLYRANELDKLGLRFGIKDLSNENTFKALRVCKQADDAGLLKTSLQGISH